MPGPRSFHFQPCSMPWVFFLEYNTPMGPVNRFSGKLEFMAILCLVHSGYGFTYSYFGIKSRRYHLIAGAFHVFLLIILWFSDYIVADEFAARNFIGLKSPYIEPELGPFGPAFDLYVIISSLIGIGIWKKHKEKASLPVFLPDRDGVLDSARCS